MQIGTSAGLHLAIVDGDFSITSDDAQESSLFVPGPAPNAGAYGSGHRNRLTLPLVRSIPRRLPGRFESHLLRVS